MTWNRACHRCENFVWKIYVGTGFEPEAIRTRNNWLTTSYLSHLCTKGYPRCTAVERSRTASYSLHPNIHNGSLPGSVMVISHGFVVLLRQNAVSDDSGDDVPHDSANDGPGAGMMNGQLCAHLSAHLAFGQGGRTVIPVRGTIWLDLNRIFLAQNNVYTYDTVSSHQRGARSSYLYTSVHHVHIIILIWSDCTRAKASAGYCCN